MRYSEAQQGRTFIIRLEDGEIVHETLERFAAEKGIRAAALLILGGADKGSRLIVGPRESRSKPVMPMQHELYEAHEVTGTGTIFPDEDGVPLLHLHMACGREENTVTGCIREGVKVWHVMEVVMFELTGTSATRRPDPEIGFKLLKP
ncbi:DNA-binding protein [Prosthecochloris sp. GSB1]|uniref:PPC domain-containing DNA-binding protein n=1 Tax=Prosthecochloris sp. GSB1 TaxID=281093 RepID=UPI000B8CDEB6|nr:PPC domain-containing DNA-binding protein [Prosthecochloris sp. GSB1]ASQ90770.1 DNA-binding protein [Prosthecochloris sp. GSB1]